MGQSEFVGDSTQFNMVPEKKKIYYINDGLLLYTIIEEDSIFLFFLTPPRSFCSGDSLWLLSIQTSSSSDSRMNPLDIAVGNEISLSGFPNSCPCDQSKQWTSDPHWGSSVSMWGFQVQVSMREPLSFSRHKL